MEVDKSDITRAGRDLNKEPLDGAALFQDETFILGIQEGYIMGSRHYLESEHSKVMTDPNYSDGRFFVPQRVTIAENNSYTLVLSGGISLQITISTISHMTQDGYQALFEVTT